MPAPNRFIGLDIHKAYMLAAGVDKDQNEVLSPRARQLGSVRSLDEENPQAAG